MDHPTKFKNMFGTNSEADRLLNLVQELEAGTSQLPFESVEIDYGTDEGTVCQGNDSRLANARTPTTHAATHKSAGSDVLKIDELGAGTDVTTLNATTLVHGLLPKLSGVATEFLNGSGGYTVPTVSSGGSATLVVAASDSSAKSKARADYVCDGTADDVQIQAAIDAIATTGGCIILLEGTFILESSIVPTNNITIQGMGASTILKGITRPISIGTASKVCISNLALDGETTYADGIYIFGGLEFIIENCYIYGYTDNGIYCAKSSENSRNGGLISGNYISDVGDYLTASAGYGIYLKTTGTDYSEYIRVVGNNLHHNGTGLKLESNNHVIICNNLSNNYIGLSVHAGLRSQIIGNTLNHNTNVGLSINGGGFCKFIGNNIVHSGNEGISIFGATHDNILHSNHIYSNGDIDTGDDHDTDIRINCSNNVHTIFSNNIIGYVGDDNPNVCVSNVNNTMTGCHFVDNIFQNKTPGNYISGWVATCGTIQNNLEGYVTETKGTATIPTSQTSVTVTHGLATTPTNVTVTPKGNIGSCWWDTPTTTTFIIHCSSAPAADVDVNWTAIV